MKSSIGAARVVQALKDGGVGCVFGVPGTQTVALFEALRRNGVRTVVTTNELSAAFMAGGWARVTGEPGVFVTIQGPGVTWALTGVAEARLDSVPLLHIAGVEGSSPKARPFRQQGIPQREIATPLVKRVVDADSHANPGAAVLEALFLASSGEPGPVMLEISSATLSREFGAASFTPGPAPGSHPLFLEALCERVRNARRPLFMVGRGVVRYANRLRTLVEQVQAPLLTTPGARGILSEDHPFNLGFDPLCVGVANVNALIESSDLIVVIGCKLAHTSTGGFTLKLPPDRLIHIDSSAEVLGANYPASLQAVGDAGDALAALLKCQHRSAWTAAEIATWRVRLRERVAVPAEPSVAGTPGGDALGFFESLRNALPSDAILVLDSGLHQIMARRYYRVLEPLGLILPTDYQSMGFGISTGIGAQLASPNRPVVALVGDGGFSMTGLELLTAVRERIPLIVIVFVDGSLGQIRMQQLEAYGASHAVSIENPDFSLFAAAIGARHLLVGQTDLEKVVRTALGNSGVTVIEVPVGDTFAIRRMTVYARARETTRRVASPRAFRLLGKLLKRVVRIIRLAPIVLLGSL